MQQQPSLSALLRYPITIGVSVLAIMGTIQFYGGADLDRFMSNTGDCLHEPWRLLIPALFHEGPIHLLFNLYWLWVFGMKVERAFGHIATLAIFTFLAVGSMAAELALFKGGIGLSGVGYGLFGMLWVLSRTDPRFRDTVDHSVVELMFGWLLVCIVLTMAGVWHVGNVAHCAGCLLGALLGWTIGARGFLPRLRSAAILTSVFLLFLAGGTNVARCYVNLINDAGSVFADRADAALHLGHPDEAIRLYEQALQANPNMYNWWRDLAIAYGEVGRQKEADAAFRRANELRPKHSDSDRAN